MCKETVIIHSNKYKAIALDLDGTLTNEKKIITKKTKTMIQLAAQAGIDIILASGRPEIGMQSIVKDLELQQLGGYIISYNGGRVINCTFDNIIYEKMIPLSLYKNICAIGKKFPVEILTYDKNSIVTENKADFFVQKEAFNNSLPLLQVNNLTEYVQYPVIKFMAVGEPIYLKQLQKEMIKQYQGELNVFFSEPYFLEIVPLGIDKASALEKLIYGLNISQQELMACGDGLNDLPMLQYAGLSIAMENACDLVKNAADYITDSNNGDGVAKAIQKFIFNLDEKKES